MTMRCLNLAVFTTSVCLLASCASQPRVLQSEGEYTREWDRNDEAQLDYKTVQQASITHDGSVPIPVARKKARRGAARRRAGEVVIKAPSGGASVAALPAEPADDGLVKVVLGPVMFEQGKSGDSTLSDAGTRVREVISQRIAKMDTLTLLDSPEDRFNIDSPRPDLARKGVRFVIKGVSSVQSAGGVYRVFLRVVDTASGKVAMIVSGKNKDPDVAAQQASERLVIKLQRAI